MEKRYVEVKSCDLTLRGYLELPDGASSESPVPLLVMFHGFTGTLSEKHFVLSRLSRRVVASGVATLRFDFGGSGESDGEFINVTPLTEVEDGQAILAFGCGLPEVDQERVGLFGFSLGGFVAINVAAREQDRLKRLVLLSPGMITHKKWSGCSGRPARLAGERCGSAPNSLRTGTRWILFSLRAHSKSRCPLCRVPGIKLFQHRLLRGTKKRSRMPSLRISRVLTTPMIDPTGLRSAPLPW